MLGAPIKEKNYKQCVKLHGCNIQGAFENFLQN